MKSKAIWTAAGGTILFALLVLVFSTSPGTAAPLPAPTPVSVAASGAKPEVIEFFNAEAMTADTTSRCTSVDAYSKADLYYLIDVDGSGAVTHTVTWQFGNDPEALVDGVAVASAVVADAESMQQYQLFGRYACLEVDMASGATGTITITANALVK